MHNFAETHEIAVSLYLTHIAIMTMYTVFLLSLVVYGRLVHLINWSCALLYAGRLCGLDIDECESEPCQNDGQCDDLKNSYRCRCANGFEGEQILHGLL